MDASRGRAGLTPTDVAKALSSPDSDSKVEALRHLATAADAAQYSEHICKCLADDDAIVRGAAVAALSQLGEPAGAPLAAEVARLLGAGDCGVRCAAAEVLGTFGVAAASHSTAVARLLEDDSEDNGATMLSIACIIERPKAALRFPKCAAAEALPKFGAEGRAFAGAVAQLLQDPNAEVRASVAASLGAMGTEGAVHEAALLARLASEQDPRVVAAIAIAVAEMGQATSGASSAAIAAVLKLLASQHPSIRSSAARALGIVGEKALQHVKHLLKCLEDRCPQVKVAAVGALAGLGPSAQVYAAEVARLATDEWQPVSVRVAALEVLPAMGLRGAAFADEVAVLLHDPSDEVRDAAVLALESFGIEAAGE